MPSGASPKAGEKRVEPKNLADVDMGALKRQMSATIEKAKADDPKELRRQLKEKDTEIARLQKAKPASAGMVRRQRSTASIHCTAKACRPRMMPLCLPPATCAAPPP